MTHQNHSVNQFVLSILLILLILCAVASWWDRLAPDAAAAERCDPSSTHGTAGQAGELPVTPLPEDVGMPRLRMLDPAPERTAVRQLSAETDPRALEKAPTPDEPRLLANIPAKIDASVLRDLRPRREAADLKAEPLTSEPSKDRAKMPLAASAGLPAWQEPKFLLERLAELNGTEATGKWAAETSRLVRELGTTMSQGSADATAAVERLEKWARQGETLAASLPDLQLARKVRQAVHALTRRLAVWSEIAAVGSQPPRESHVARTDANQLSLCLSELESLMGNSSEGQAWRKFLLVDALRECSSQQPWNDSGVAQDLAREALVRMTKAPLSAEQRFFVSSGPVAALRVELRRLTAEPVSSAALLAHLEQYEASRQSADARLLARDCQSLKVLPERQCRALGQQIETNYRNANVRLAVSAELLNRLMPKRNPEAAPVYDSVLGVPVRGQSLTSTHLAVKLLPDPSRVRLALEATGQVDSVTNATSGPATFYNRGTAYYTARKAMEVDLKGIRLETTDVDVQNEMRLQGLQTDFDGIPLVSMLAHRIARSQHEMNRDAAEQEVRAKVANKARQRIDTETTEQVTEFARRFDGRVLAPLYSLALEPTMIGAETTEQRFLMRMRLAGDEQVGSHTPRPQAPADSLASVQAHESAINNALENLNLDGRSFTLAELSKHVADRLCREEMWEIEPENGDVVVSFAAQDAVRVHCQDGQMVLTLSLAKLSKGRTHWKDFQVRVFFRPQVNGRSAELVRDGVIHLIGQLKPTSQIALRGVFARIFPRKTNWNLTPERLLTSPELADSAITQFTIDDGWMGIALGPKPPVSTARQAPLHPGILRR